MTETDGKGQPGGATEGSPRPIRFSVYIPIWNEGGWLPRAIESVLAQTYPDWELIVGDNASDDDLATIVARYPDPRIRYVRWPRHVPMSENHNRTMLLGRFEWQHALSADDRMHSTALEAIAERIRASDATGRPVMVVGACRRVDEHGDPTDLVDGHVGRSGIYQPFRDRASVPAALDVAPMDDRRPRPTWGRARRRACVPPGSTDRLDPAQSCRRGRRGRASDAGLRTDPLAGPQGRAGPRLTHRRTSSIY